MKKTFLILTFLLIIIAAGCGTKKDSTSLLEQNTYERNFKNFELALEQTIYFDSLSNPISRPTWCLTDSDTNIYIFNYTTQKVHKLFKNSGYKNSIMFGGVGSGPGEFSNPMDFKIYKDTLYISDEPNARIEVFNKDGKYIKSISLSNNLTPVRITFLDDKIVVLTLQYQKEKMFSLTDKTGKVINQFGKLMDPKNDGNIYNDTDLSTVIDENRFYYFPKYLGFATFYIDGKVQFSRKTIDGNVEKPKEVTKKYGENTYVTKLEYKFYTIMQSELGENYILIKALHKEKDIRYYDIYSKADFEYLFSTKEFPTCSHFHIVGNKLICLDDFNLKIFNISKLNKLVSENF